MDESKCIIIALDNMNLVRAVKLASDIGPDVKGFKVRALAERYGEGDIVKILREAVQNCWLWTDINGCDTPDTIEERARTLAAHGYNAVSVMAIGGPEMIAAAKKSGIYIIAVTLLSSWTDRYIMDTFQRRPSEVAWYLGQIAAKGGADALECSPKHVQYFAGSPQFAHLKLIVEGTRSQGQPVHDQKQVDTPQNAIANGADWLVVGRQLTQAVDTKAMLLQLAGEISAGLKARAGAQ